MRVNRSACVAGVGAILGVAAVGCGPSDEPVDGGNTPTDAGPSTPDSGRDAFTRTGDPWDNYEAAITAARREECDCSWEEQGFKSAASCLEYTLGAEDVINCAEEGYLAARSASAAHYDCVTPALDTYAACRETAACAEAASSACAMTVNGALGGCPELPDEASEAFSTCFQREFIGPAGTCPEAGDPWMGTGVYTGTTTLGGNDSNPSEICFGGTIPSSLEISPDRAYRWIAPSAGVFAFDSTDSEFDTILYLQRSCSTPIFECNDDINLEGGIYSSRVTFTATAAGDEVIVVIDGYSAQSSGAFTVTVTQEGDAPDGGVPTPDGGVGDAGVPPSDGGDVSDAGVPAADGGASDAGVADDAHAG